MCVAEVVERYRPDVASPQSGLPVRMARALRQHGVPVAIYFRNVEQDDLGGSVTGSANCYIANSRFTAERVRELYGVESTVIPPIFDAGRYKTSSSRHYVTFINPHAHKGRDIAFALARLCPEIPFLFVRAWTLSESDEQLLLACAAECPNVTIRRSTNDMRSIYSETKLVLAPSQWEEAWGRIATEAHFSGIPVLASNIGGLPEAVGDGGLLLPKDAPAEIWAEAIRSVLNDPEEYSRRCAAAYAFSERPEIRIHDQVQRFVECCRDAISNESRS